MVESQHTKPPPRLTKSLHSPLHDRFTLLFREMRFNARLSQSQAANILGIRQSLISDIERGERRVDVIEFLRFCDAYSCSPSEFLRHLQNSEKVDIRTTEEVIKQ